MTRLATLSFALVLLAATSAVSSDRGRHGLFVGCGFHGDQVELFHTWTGNSSLRKVSGTWVGAWNVSHHFAVGRTMRDRLGMSYGPLRGVTRFLSERCRRRIADRYHHAGGRYRIPAELVRGLGRCPRGQDPAHLPWGRWVPVLCVELSEPVTFEVWGPDDAARPAASRFVPWLVDGEDAEVPVPPSTP